MALTQDQIESLFTRLPMVRPPENIYELANADVSAQRLYDATHQLTAAVRDAEADYHVLGMHLMGTKWITLAGDAPESTVVHEAVHRMGVRSEPATYAITRGLMARAKFNLGLRMRPVHYTAVPVSDGERSAFLDAMHLSLAPGETRSVDLVHLAYVPG